MLTNLTGLLRSGKKVWKMKHFPGQGKVREFQFQSGKFRKKLEKSGKSQGISEFSKKVNCLQASEKYNFYKLQVVYGQKHYFYNSHGLRHSLIN